MTELIRDTAFGHLVRFVSRGKLLKYAEEADPSLYKNYIDQKASGYLADHGDTNPREDGTEPDGLKSEKETNGQDPTKTRSSSQGTGDTKVDSDDDTHVNQASGVKVDPEKGQDKHVIGWWGDNDTENPQNWSLGKKCFVTFEICLLTTSVYIGSSIYSAGTQSVMMTFGVSQVAATLGLCLFVAGYGLGPMLWSPMSEIPQVGRNPIYLGTLVVFVGLQPAVARAENFGMLLAFRFITGFFGSPVLATGGASLADIWSPKKRAYSIAIWGIAAVSGPTLGPLVGGFAVQYGPYGPGHGGFTAPWTWPLWELMWLSAFCLVFLFFALPETSANNILLRRTRRIRKITGDDKLTCQPEIVSEQMTGKDIVMMSLVRPFTLNFLEPMVFLLNLYIALIYGLLYIWFESFVIVFVEIYGFGLGAEGLAFLGIFVGAFIVIPPFFAYLYFVLEPQFDEEGNVQPEKRLVPCFVGAFCIPICLFWFGWSSRPDVHWIVPIIGSAWFSIGAFCLFNSILNYLPDAYPEYAASVLAGNDFMRSAFGAGFPLFANAMYTDLGVAWASSTLAFISIAFIPIPFVLYKYGATLRKNYSKHARKDI
ncbi:Putative major facilitator superfamily, MFS transporter superfamily [Septoria linicola]|uniref:Cercosporin MFS transporter CTB4 n=1 Tax=Septoria linicola TaxID=215465 RepID=A0A9Q9ADC9_9PEZI|nr:putative major facilitator superfamily, MFS transporter superfamily [Septoria linicola]USW47045.1 Putative major facilitator superfamily, MFS transporter superfamily [Septoria linicola]